MINFFPRMYEDELLYSAIARYKQRSGIISKRQLIEDLFGRYTSVSSSFFPQYVGSFVDQFPPESKLTADEIIEKHTMLGLYTAFMSGERTSLVKNQMKHHDGSLNVEKYLGLGGGTIRQSNYLRYCPLCFSEDLETMGESYWRRSHQIIGALYCVKHLILLKGSIVSTVDINRNYMCADEETCDSSVIVDTYPEEIKTLNLTYMINAEYLLKSTNIRKDLPFIMSFYIDKLRDKGLASGNGSLHMKRLLEQFLEFYPHYYLQLMQSEVNVDSKSNWLRRFVRSNMNYNRIFVRHLLLLQFLNVHPRELFECKHVVGKNDSKPNHNPQFSIIDRRQQWLQLIAENPSAKRTDLKELGKGLYTWITRHDWNWYDDVTPKPNRASKRISKEDWMEKDKKYLKLVKEAHKAILNTKGKPLRVTPTAIRNKIGAGTWLRNPNLKKTNEYLKDNLEDIDCFRKRKIKWAIKDMERKNLPITVYKVQLYAGFGGGSKEIKRLIYKVLNNQN